jgi:hypothetical protein
VAVLHSAASPAGELAYFFPCSGHVEYLSSKAFTDFASPTDTHVTGGITFNLFYEDVRVNSGTGFNGPAGAAAQARIKDVLDELAAALNETGTLDIFFRASQTDGDGALASAGSAYSQAAGYQSPISLLRIQNGAKPNAGFAEINVTVDFGYNYNFSAAPTGSGAVDFFTVMLHEFTHGLGFASFSSPNGSSNFFPNTRTNFDAYLVKGQGGASLWNSSGVYTGTAGNPSPDLISNDLFFEGVNAAAQYAQSGTQPGIFAPNALNNGDPWFGDDVSDGVTDGFMLGSSMSHFDTFNIVGGAVMEHTIVTGTDRRQYSPVDVGVLRDIGWTSAAVPSEGEGEGEGEGEAPCTMGGPCPNFDAEAAGVYGGLSVDYTTADLDLSGIPDSYEIALFREVLCGRTGPLHDEALCAFAGNRDTLREEADYDDFSYAENVLTAALSIGSEFQAAVKAALGLSGVYSVVDGAAKAVGEPLSAAGDPDADGLTNKEEYDNTVLAGFGRPEFVLAALNPLLDGSTDPADLPAGNPLGIALLAGVLGALGACLVLGVSRRSKMHLRG